MIQVSAEETTPTQQYKFQQIIFQKTQQRYGT